MNVWSSFTNLQLKEIFLQVWGMCSCNTFKDAKDESTVTVRKIATGIWSGVRFMHIGISCLLWIPWAVEPLYHFLLYSIACHEYTAFEGFL